MNKTNAHTLQVDALRFAVELNRWSPPADLLQATFYRGVIIAAWAQIDGCLSEALVRCKAMPVYASLMPNAYPPQRRERIGLLRLLLASDGPLKRWAPHLERILAEFEEADALRHLMAHGRMKVLANWGATFTDWTAIKGAVVEGRRRMPLPELEAAAARWAKLARKVDYFLTIAGGHGIMPGLAAT